MSLFTEGEGNTALSAEEQADLIPNLATKDELNEWERQNILEAYAWALAPNNVRRHDPLVESYIRDLHLRMFDQTWKWAGVYRTSEKNIGVPHHEIRESLATLLGDACYWLEHETYPPDELAVRFHHRLVSYILSQTAMAATRVSWRTCWPRDKTGQSLLGVARIWSERMTFVDVTLTRYAPPMRKISDLCWRSHAPEVHHVVRRRRD